MKNVRNMYGICTEHVWNMYGTCMEHVWKTFKNCCLRVISSQTRIGLRIFIWHWLPSEIYITAFKLKCKQSPKWWTDWNHSDAKESEWPSHEDDRQISENELQIETSKEMTNPSLKCLNIRWCRRIFPLESGSNILSSSISNWLWSGHPDQIFRTLGDSAAGWKPSLGPLSDLQIHRWLLKDALPAWKRSGYWLSNPIVQKRAQWEMNGRKALNLYCADIDVIETPKSLLYLKSCQIRRLTERLWGNISDWSKYFQ
jgi:hypothetical protein